MMTPQPYYPTGKQARVPEKTAFAPFRARLRDYWALIKSLQTGLLLFTGIAGFVNARCPVTSWPDLAALTGSLFLAISGSTVLNMVYDRDIDTKMCRTAQRPLPAHRLVVKEAMLVGLVLAFAGVAWAVALSPLYGLVVFAGLFFDVVVYTVWLKRRTSWSIVWGGIAGGMPVLAGRVLAVGRIDLLGVLLALSVLFWIPTHIMTFSIKYAEDYRRAGIPVFPNTHGVKVTRIIIGFSTAAAAITMLSAAWLLGLEWGYFQVAAILGTLLTAMAVVSVVRPSPKLNLYLFKFASLYMLGAMGLIAVG